MDPSLLDILRCPIDPVRTATLTRDRDTLVCNRCAVRFPVRNGLPILIPDEAELPAGYASRSALPCQNRTAR
jgi:uncharacterized protein YbaR (Trm112 family)